MLIRRIGVRNRLSHSTGVIFQAKRGSSNGDDGAVALFYSRWGYLVFQLLFEFKFGNYI